MQIEDNYKTLNLKVKLFMNKSNIFVERLWRSVKYEEVYPNGYQTMEEAYHGLHRYFEFYNHQRPHQALDYRTPAEAYADRIINLSLKSAEVLP